VADRTLRLACICCDRVDGDGITMREALKAGWQGITELVVVFQEDDWWDHLGECLDCYRENTPKADKKKRRQL
jgi:hypothetical protein